MEPILRYNCNWCQYSGKRKDKLTNHLKTKHPDLNQAQLRQTATSTSDRVQASTSDLLDFVKVTIQNGQTSLEIPEETAESVEQEEDTETEGVYYNCAMCPYSSRNRNSLNSHVAASHRTPS